MAGALPPVNERCGGTSDLLHGQGGLPVRVSRRHFDFGSAGGGHGVVREQILKAVWGFDFEPSSNSLDVYVMYLRRKTEAGGEPRLVHTVRGVGYVLRQGGAE